MLVFRNAQKLFGPHLRKTLLLGISCCAMAAKAEPYIPDNDSTIITRLPSAVVAMSQQLRATEGSRNDNPQQLFAQAYRSYQLALTEQDPRAYGRTLAIIEQWPDNVGKPVSLRLIAAAVLQHNHEFVPALDELRTVLEEEPGNAQALMIQAQIGLVTAHYPLTQQSCDALVNRVERAFQINCQAQLDGVTGKADTALDTLTQELDSGRPMSRQALLEIHITIATIAHRLGENDMAGQHYLAALTMAPDNTYLLSNYAQWLLQQERYRDVIALLGSEPDPTSNVELGVMLTNALLSSSDAANSNRAASLIAELEAYFETAYRRGENLPVKEFARFALDIQGRPEAALEAAMKNWSSQKEPSDALLLAEAATAASRQDVIENLRDWTGSTGMQYAALDTLIAAGDAR